MRNNGYEFDAKKVTEGLCNWVADWFEKNGKDCNAVIGISGGVDSSTVAAACVRALGKDRVFGVLMPDGVQYDIGDSKLLVDHLGVNSITCDIHSSVFAVRESIENGNYRDNYVLDFIKRIGFSKQMKINLPPRIRMCTLYAVSQSINGRVINTCNLSESYCGYDTIFGDSAGDMSPLAMLTKTEVRAVAKELGLPDELVNKVPTDGLCRKTDEEVFGFTYDVLDRYLRTGEIDDLEAKKKIDTLHEKNLFKLQPMARFEYKIGE